MLDFSRGENDSVPVKKTAVDIAAVLADAIAENEHEITKRGLNVDFEKKEVTVNTDKDLFSQAIGNLINNAALYAKESSTISVTCEPGKIVISNVAAEAVEDAAAMKQPFAKGSESRKNYGSGLGLAIAENNLVLLGYKLDVKSEGGKFVVTVTL
jgi:signal transduction histidine kinase